MFVFELQCFYSIVIRLNLIICNVICIFLEFISNDFTLKSRKFVSSELMGLLTRVCPSAARAIPNPKSPLSSNKDSYANEAANLLLAS